MTNKQAAERLSKLGREMAEVFDGLEDRSFVEPHGALLDEVLGCIDNGLDQIDEAIRQLSKS